MVDVPRTADAYRAADLILFDGTVLSLDAASRRHEAVAVRNGQVLALGGTRDMLSLAGERTRLVDLGGRTAMPGFIETHNHPLFYGMTLEAPVDAGTPPNDSITDIVDRVGAAADSVSEDEWIRGYRYDDTLLRDNRHPTRHDLDSASPSHPVVLLHVSGHLAAVNSVGLAKAGITRETPDPPGGTIIRDDRGDPTGVLAETAAFAVYAMLPTKGRDEMAATLGLAGDAYLANGITTVHDTGVGLMGGAGELDAYRTAIDSGRFRTRVHAYLFHDIFPQLGDGVLSPLEAGIAGLGDDRFRLRGAKIIADGSIQGLTGYLTDGYACAPNRHGTELYPRDELSRRIATLHDAGWQVAVHGNGDAAIGSILDAYTSLGLKGDESHRRHRVEHCQTVREDQLDVMAEHAVLASFFIKHVYYWGDRHRDIFLGPERARRISPLASAQSRGLRFGLHSDTPVVPVPPLEGIWCAVRRTTRDGADLGPEQRVSVETALRGYTSDAAYLGFEEDRAGSLEPGKLADVTVLSADPTSIDPDDLCSVTVEATFVNGERAWQSGPAATNARSWG